jgi:hypothetical protein
MLIVFTLMWGVDCAAWSRSVGSSRGAAFWRCFSLPVAFLLGYALLAELDKTRTIVLLLLSAIATSIGTRWGRRKHPEPTVARPRVGDYSSDVPWNYSGYSCWKCGRFGAGEWPYEATLQDRERKNHAFAWHPICDSCISK